MSDLRFEVGAAVMCNLGPSGWKLGRVIALYYREDHWPADTAAPYQVALEADHALVYVPEDDDRYCRAATREDVRIARRMDALAALPESQEGAESRPESEPIGTGAATGGQLGCAGSPGYRGGRCHCCDCCPRNWSSVELYSEHYRCAERNGLRVTRHAVDLGTVRVGDSIHHSAGEGVPSRQGFMQCPTLVRLPPGVRFSDDGALAGEVQFDPHRDAEYRVEFVAVGTAAWDNAAVGIVRLEITFVVEGNEPPDGFDADAFEREQRQARAAADRTLRALGEAWERWERDELDNRETCDRMLAELGRLRELLERHPRLDGGMWWAQLGGYHMNVHKLLENALFECELYLGHALTFGDPEVRWLAEQNLDGCYQKRLLEAARFLWIDGCEQMMRGEWAAAAATLRLAAAKKDGWGWAVNFGDIWFTESAARLVYGAELAARNGAEDGEAVRWLAEAARLLEKGVTRTSEARHFGPEGHPWAVEIGAALASYRRLRDSGGDTAEWRESLKLRTAYWCAQVLGGAAPFPPQPRPRREDAAALVRRLPGHNEGSCATSPPARDTRRDQRGHKDEPRSEGEEVNNAPGFGWRFENTYADLPKEFFAEVSPAQFRSPRVAVLNRRLAAELGLSIPADSDPAVAAVFAGQALPAGARPIAQAYAGHQFGGFTMLGDGRAILLGEHRTLADRLVDVQLKGPGPTPYSRGGDGLAALGPMLREYIVSEAMHALGVPTTRSLAVVTTGEKVRRETRLPGAVLTRVAASHVRVGTFEYAATFLDEAAVRALADYTIARHYPELAREPQPYLAFLRAVIDRQAALVARWQLVGFVHGVMNTDNMAVSGETIDYGPCAFLDEYHPDTVFSSIDDGGRYAYKNQPSIAQWNVCRFAETLLPLLDVSPDEAVKLATDAIEAFTPAFDRYWLGGMRRKLGLQHEEAADRELIQALLAGMQHTRADLTNTFRQLAETGRLPLDIEKDKALGAWRARWAERLGREGQTPESAGAGMRAANPAVIPRNHRVEQALAAAEDGDMSVLHDLLAAVTKPFDAAAVPPKYRQPPPANRPRYRTFCGT